MLHGTDLVKRAAPTVPRLIAVANQKGGVGKTTTAVNLATALAYSGHRVLLVDLDPQGNASTGVGIAQTDRARGSYAMLIHQAPLATLMRGTAIDNLAIIPAEMDLAGAEIELVGQARREHRLRDLLRDAPAPMPPLAFILIDCPPSLGLLTLNALVAADSVLVPLQCEFFALEGISQLMRSIELVRRAMNPHLAVEGIVLTMFDRRNNLSELVAADARGFFGAQVFETVIPRNIRISEAPSHGKPVLLYDGRSAGALAYTNLAAELLRRRQTPPDPRA